MHSKLITTALGVGYSPVAPGTMGALLATALWWLASSYLDSFTLRIATAISIVVITLISIPAIRRVEKEWGEDPSRVVIDEVVGTWICLLGVPESMHWGYVLAAFLLFRFFDILKPLGIRRMESIGGGWGVMLDDILAGIYGLLLLLIITLIHN